MTANGYCILKADDGTLEFADAETQRASQPGLRSALARANGAWYNDYRYFSSEPLRPYDTAPVEADHTCVIMAPEMKQLFVLTSPD